MKTYGLPLLACLSISGVAFADGTESFDFSLDIVPAGQNTPLDFTGILTFDSSTGQFLTGSSGSLTNFISSPLGSIGEASASEHIGASPTNTDTLTFGWSTPLGIAEVTPITFGNWVQPANPEEQASCNNNDAGAMVCMGSQLIKQSATAAPEIDVNSAGCALTVLAGFVAVVRRQRVPRQPARTAWK